jgi:hypothetical protein
MQRIEVKEISREKDVMTYEVTIMEGVSSTSHKVSVSEAELSGLVGGDISGEKLIEESFKFLLEREPKEQILAEFPISEIIRYFPDYESQISKRCK